MGKQKQRVAIYARVSTTEGKQTPENQLRTYAKARDFAGQHIPDIPEQIIRELQQAIGGELVVEQEASIDRGSEVSIIEGPFKDFLATVSRSEKADKRVALLLDFLGREMEVFIPRDFVIARTSVPAALESCSASGD